MKDILSIVKADIENLRQAQAQDDSEQRDRSVESLEKHLLIDEGYKQLCDERVLSIALRQLDQELGSEIKDRLTPLTEWLKIGRDINNKFYAILSHEVDLDELLFSYFSKWKILEDEIACNFDDETKERFRSIRENDGSEQKIQSFVSAYLEYAKLQNPNQNFIQIEAILSLVIKSFTRLLEWNVQALFSLSSVGDVYGIKIIPTPNGTGLINAFNEVTIETNTAARRAYELVKNKYPAVKDWDIKWDIERGDISYSGNSIGLALTIGIISAIEGWEIDPYTAFTGHANWNTGKIEAVGDLDKKIQAAKELGIRRVFIPSDNDDIQIIPGLDIIPIDSIEGAIAKLGVKTYISSNSKFERQAEYSLKELESALALKGIKAVGGIEIGNNFKRLVFTDFQDQIFVNIHFSKSGIKPVVQQKNCLLRNTIQALCDQLFEKSSNEITSDIKRKKYIVSDKIIQSRVEQHILSLPFSVQEAEKNCLYRAKLSKNNQTVFIRQFNNGTLTIDGREPLFSEINSQLQTVLGVSALPDTNEIKLEKQIEAVRSVELGNQWIGTDEAGKGDYFGPLVGAAVFVNRDLADRLLKLGVKDSKQLSDNRNREIASKITAICGKRSQVVSIPPARYNQLYRQFKQEGKNLNTLLAWVHTRALEDILTTFPQNDQLTVIIDKFADEQYIKNKLLENARRTGLNLIQLPKAEANIAVAAASILARAKFLNWLEQTSQELKVSLPKGSSDPKIAEIARLIIQKYGQDKLAEVAKLHFKTTENVLSS